jgi:gluconolactonase
MSDERIVEPAGMRALATGLGVPEGPVALADGSVLVVEMGKGVVTRVARDGAVSILAEVGGAPNGLAMGPDEFLWVANNDLYYEWSEHNGLMLPNPAPGPKWRGHGRLQRVDLATGDVSTAITHCAGRALLAPNDLVFDAEGGLWFTDHGVDRSDEAHAAWSGVCYVPPGGDEAREVPVPLDRTNGIGLSPAGDRLYVAETFAGRLWAADVTGPGQVGEPTLLGDPEGVMFDSLAVDGDGWVCVGTLGAAGGITSYAPDGSAVEKTALPDPLVTNVCFGQDGATAYATLTATSQLVALAWPRPGGRLHFAA